MLLPSWVTARRTDGIGKSSLAMLIMIFGLMLLSTIRFGKVPYYGIGALIAYLIGPKIMVADLE